MYILYRKTDGKVFPAFVYSNYIPHGRALTDQEKNKEKIFFRDSKIILDHLGLFVKKDCVLDVYAEIIRICFNTPEDSCNDPWWQSKMPENIVFCHLNKLDINEEQLYLLKDICRESGYLRTFNKADKKKIEACFRREIMAQLQKSNQSYIFVKNMITSLMNNRLYFDHIDLTPDGRILNNDLVQGFITELNILSLAEKDTILDELRIMDQNNLLTELYEFMLSDRIITESSFL
jgi:hypothetical protein